MNRRIPNLSRVFQAGAYGRPNGGPWTPLAISSLVAWADPNFYAYSDAGSTAAVHGGDLYRLACRYPNQTYYAENATAGGRTYGVGANGKAYFTTNGASNDFRLTIPSTALTAGEIWVMWKRTGTFNGDLIFRARRVSSGNPILECYDGAGTGTSAVARSRDNSGSLNQTAVTNVGTSWQTVAARYTGAATKILTNNVERQTVAQTGTITIDVIGIGCEGFSAASPSDGVFGHLLVFNANLSTADATNLQTYLEAEYPT